MKKTIIKPIVFVLIFSLVVCAFSSCSKSRNSTPVQASAKTEIKGIYLGVKDSKNATRDIVLNNKSRVFQFEIDGKTQEFCVECNENDYSIQNRLMMGYEYLLQIDGDKIMSAKIVNKSDIEGVVSGYKPGERTLKNFLQTAVSPLGKTVYVYGGGWNFQDDGSSYMARTIGLSPTWEKFYKTTDANYSYKKDTYPDNEWNTYYYAGLDCSGFIGWVLYNTMYTETEKEEGFVCSSTKMAKTFADNYKYGTFEHNASKDYRSILKKLHPGDIVSMSGHAYIIIGVCEDDSAVILHSTVTKSSTGIEGGGVQFSALSLKGDDDTSCKAYKLAKEYTEKYFPEWASKYPVVVRTADPYLNFPDEKETTGVFSWNNDQSGLTDAENIKNMSAEDVLKTIFNNN